ncbi:ssDNA endodeoxyribonuclease [Puccinia graminis f. sp. tritici]|uniref:SsDNA endodeoxyribonuclease n=1 Tax=Puccinia graminis f. sp. tritici TaxID=56615 RepID=A0A5B0NDW8_PUCGR|nr:ssDNA endodeoxyribonuclease [Puccinia graminis f. sp. tritici]KAA1129390.1 ssDNA endodeoxyribonuclease [Puccinia graminis f. sp. tritici]
MRSVSMLQIEGSRSSGGVPAPWALLDKVDELASTTFNYFVSSHTYIEKNVTTDNWHFKPTIIPNSQKEKAKNLGDSEHLNEEESGKRKNDDDEEEDEFDVKFEVLMSSLIECLNIFGTAASSSHKTYTKNFANSSIDNGSSVAGLPAKRRFDDDSLAYQKGKPGPSKARKLPTSAVRISYTPGRVRRPLGVTRGAVAALQVGDASEALFCHTSRRCHGVAPC